MKKDKEEEHNQNKHITTNNTTSPPLHWLYLSPPSYFIIFIFPFYFFFVCRVQARVRGFIERKRFVRLRKATLTIQSFTRGWFARLYVRCSLYPQQQHAPFVFVDPRVLCLL